MLHAIWGRLFAVPTAGVVATSEVNCYNSKVRLRSLPRFAETINRGTVAQRNEHGLLGWIWDAAEGSQREFSGALSRGVQWDLF